MNRSFATPVRLSMLGAALLLLAGCAAPPHATHWSRVSQRDQHQFMPAGVWDERPTVVVTAGPGGLVVGTGPDLPAPAAHLVAQDGQLRLVSPQTFATLNQGQPGRAMGAGPAGTAPAGSQPAPAR